jgi:hypothetical protein
MTNVETLWKGVTVCRTSSLMNNPGPHKVYNSFGGAWAFEFSTELGTAEVKVIAHIALKYLYNFWRVI